MIKYIDYIPSWVYIDVFYPHKNKLATIKQENEKISFYNTYRFFINGMFER